jgi:uncharacterized iron-regulated protein
MTTICPTFAHDRQRAGRSPLVVAVLLMAVWGCSMTSQRTDTQGVDAPGEAGTILAARTGKPIPYDRMVADLRSVRLIFVGERHLDRAHHRAQLQLARELYRHDSRLTVGMEMFDHSYQAVLDRWSSGQLDEDTFLKQSHWYANWRYDFELYRDLLDFIKANRIRLVGLNIPFHIPPKIAIGGLENLSADEQKHLPRHIDTTQAAHRAYLADVFERHPHAKGRDSFDNFYLTQCVWEDTMAEAVARNLTAGGRMLVLAGNGHIIRKFGIPDRAYARTGASFRTVYLASDVQDAALDYADYVWITPADPVPTHSAHP